MADVPRQNVEMENATYVRMNDVIGTIFLGILSIFLLVALLQSEARYRSLLARIANP